MILRKSSQNEDIAEGIMIGDEPFSGMKLKSICRGHRANIGRIAWSHCGRFIVTPSTDGTIRIWDANSGTCLHVNDIKKIVLCVEWSPDGKYIGYGMENGISGIIEVSINSRSEVLAEEIFTMKEHTKLVWSFVFSPNSKTFASAGADGRIIIVDIASQDVNNVYNHISSIRTLEWTPNGTSIIFGDSEQRINIWDIGSNKLKQSVHAHSGAVTCLSSKHLLNVVASSGASDSSIWIWNMESWTNSFRLEGHADSIWSLDFSFDGRVLASKSEDGSIRLWDVPNWVSVLKFNETVASNNQEYYSGLNPWAGIAFHPSEPLLATMGENDQIIRVWEIDIDELTGSKPNNTIHYTSAKVVLLGESNIGKSCLSMRLVENRFPDDNELETTHGMRFWKMDAENLHPSAKPPEGEERDIVLWDFGGQDEYQLVHQLFLHDTTVALILIDPTRGQSAIDDALECNKKLEKHLDEQHAIKLLVGAKQDKKSPLINEIAIEELCKECGFAGYIETSAKTNRNIKKLRLMISNALKWDKMAKTSRPELFQQIRDNIEQHRKQEEIVLPLDTIKHAIRESSPKLYEESAVEAVSNQLARQGVIVRTKLTKGEEVLVLQLPVIERYAGSLIVIAHNNPRGVPVIEELLLGSIHEIPLPGIPDNMRVARDKEQIVLECIVELMIKHGICFRHSGLLVFPTLFPPKYGKTNKLPHSVSLYYDFTGAIDNIYASLIARLMMSDEFGVGRLWPGRVEFDRPEEGVCGIRQIKRTGGLAHIDLFFAEETQKKRRELFTGFIEEHLRRNGVEIHEHQTIKCRGCDEEISERIVQANIAAGRKDVVCSICRTYTLISEGVEKIRKHDPESNSRIHALRNNIKKRATQDAVLAKRAVSGLKTTHRKDKPIRLLHLSDLHFTADTSVRSEVFSLSQDIKKGLFLGFDAVEYLVISGDITDRGNEIGFEKGREFVQELIDELGLSAQRCFLAPGNHDVQDLSTSYDWHDSIDGIEHDRWIQKDDIYLVQNHNNYPYRFKKFSDLFFHKIRTGEPYSLDPTEQGLSHLFSDDGVQILTLNSAWEIDQFHRKRSGIHPEAVTATIDRAEQEIKKALTLNNLRTEQQVLRLAVWHHALEGPEAMQNDTFLDHLQGADVRICLHGDVHESRRKWLNYWEKGGVHIIGAGAFGAPAKERPESTPALYNLLEIERDFSSIRVHTRSKEKAGGTWDGFYRWPAPDKSGGKVPYFDINLVILP